MPPLISSFAAAFSFVMIALVAGARRQVRQPNAESPAETFGYAPIAPWGWV